MFAALLSAGVVTATCDAHAQQPQPVASGPRARLGVGMQGGYARYGALPFTNVGLLLRAGVQASELFALELQGSGVFFMGGFGRANLYADFKVHPWFGVAIGPSVSASLFGEASASMVGGSVRTAVQALPFRHPDGVRTALSLAIELDLGATLGASCGECTQRYFPGEFSWALYASVGYLRF